MTEEDLIFNPVQVLRVGELHHRFSGSLQFSGKTVKEIVFTQPVTQKNIQKIVKECWECEILRVHTSTFLGPDRTFGCSRKKSKKLAKIEITANQLRKVIMIMDDIKPNGAYVPPSDVPYCLKINLDYPTGLNRYERCEIHFIPEGIDEGSIEIFKSWVVDDEIIDIFSRPDCLRKLTYFAKVVEAELRGIKISYEPNLYIPGSVRYTNMIHQPVFYPQAKRYPCGPFNGTILTYISTNRKQIKTYKPVHIPSEVLVMNFPDAAVFILSETTS